MIIWGCPLIALGLLIIPFPLASEKTTFYVVQAFSIVLLSFGNGLMMPSINSMVSSNTPAASQGQILGLLQGIGSLVPMWDSEPRPAPWALFWRWYYTICFEVFRILSDVR